MAGLAAAHRTALAALIERAPDDTLKTIAKVVGKLPGEKATELSALLAEQQRDRRRRADALNAVVPMFRSRADGVEAVGFPSAVLPRLWAAAAAREAALVDVLDQPKNPDYPAVRDRLCQAAASAARDTPDVVWPADLAPARRAEGLIDLACALDLSPLLRRGLASLQAWVKRPDEDQIAELRLLLRDCAEVHPDGSRRALDVMFAHLDDAVLILRILSQASTGSTRESFLSGTEMAGFVDRLIAAVQARVTRIIAFNPARDLAAVDPVIADLNWCGAVLAELNVTMELDRDGLWGRQALQARVTLSSHVEGLLRAADKAVTKALPTERVRTAGHMTRRAPQLTSPADGEGITAALTLLRLIGALRGPAAVFGVEAARVALVETLTARLGEWADQALGDIPDAPPADAANGFALIEISARGLDALGADDAARTVRRRVAAARTPVAMPEPSSQAA